MFSTILLTSASLVISGRNPVHSVLFLILSFFNAAALFLLVGAELLAMTLVIVYVGAVAVLFLFVVMMLDINFRDLRKGMMKYGIIGSIVGGIFAIELVTMGWAWMMSPAAPQLATQPIDTSITNTHAIGNVLYTDYIYLFQISGLILLVAMIGAIVLTLRHRKGVKRQNINDQLSRTVANTLVVNKVPSNQGVRKVN
jgi:NADH-quinone oxidoreductase subunit J